MAERQIGRYQVIRELGRGGMATVFLAHDPRMSRDVAIKVLPRQFLHDPQFLGRFEREAKVIASLEHPAIVPVYDFGEVSERPYLVMRHMGGGSLADRIKQGPMTLGEASNIVTRIASALDEAHSRGMIHRDLKPGNILFDERGDAYLSDFGIVKLAESTDTYTGSAIVGTPAYISPEQVHGDKVLDGRSDIYSLGIILFQMLTGRAPYQADTPGKMMMAHVMDPVPSILAVRKDLPAGCETVIVKSMAKDRDQRYRTAGEMAADLQAVAQNKSIPPAPPELSQTNLARPAIPQATATVAPPKTRRKGISRSTWLIVGGLLILFFVICGGGLIAAAVGGFLTTSPDTREVTPSTAGATTSTASPVSGTATQRAATAALIPTASPSETPEVEPSLTVIPSPTIAEFETSDEPQVVVEFSSVNVRSGPGANYEVVGVMSRGETARIVARTEDSTWYIIDLPGDELGWISASVVAPTEGSRAEDVPIAATIPPPPIIRPTSTPTAVPYGSSNFNYIDPFFEANEGRQLASEEILKPLAQFSTLLLFLAWFVFNRQSYWTRVVTLRRQGLTRQGLTRQGLTIRLLAFLASLVGVCAVLWIQLQ